MTAVQAAEKRTQMPRSMPSTMTAVQAAEKKFGVNGGVAPEMTAVQAAEKLKRRSLTPDMSDDRRAGG